MGSVVKFERPAPRNRLAGHRRPCACPQCRRCSECHDLIESLGLPQANQCALKECPMRGMKTLDEVFADFGRVVMSLPAPRKSQRPKPNDGGHGA